MSDSDTSKPGGDIVDQLLDPGQFPLGNIRLNAEQIQRLADALRSGGKTDDVALERAIHHLARVRPTEETAGLIAGLLTQSDLPSIKSAATAALGLISGPAADKALAVALQKATSRAEVEILSALASAGGKAGLAALKALKPVQNTRLMGRRAFAETMIAYRLGKVPSAPAERVTTPAAMDLNVRKETKKRVKEVLGMLDGKPFGFSYRDDLGFSFDCGGACHFVLINAGFQKGEMLKSAFAERRIAAIVLREEHREGRFVPRRIVLLRPEKGRARISVTSTQGDLMMVGTLVADGDGAMLNIRDVGEARPVTVEGRVTEKGLDLSAQIFLAVTHARQPGQTVTKRGLEL